MPACPRAPWAWSSAIPHEISSYLIPHPVIRKVTFTGSTPVGKQLAALAGPHMKRATMELGGHAPVIVAEDADVALAVKAAGGAKFRNAGQVCISPTRFLVHNSLKDEFTAALVKHAQGLKLGDGLAEGTTLGPLANERRVVAMSKIVAEARERGAKIATGGERVGSAGNFFAPTVLADVPLEAVGLQRRALRPDRGGARLRRARGRDRRGQPAALRSGGLRLHEVDQERPSARAAAGSRHVVDQPARHALGRRCPSVA